MTSNDRLEELSGRLLLIEKTLAKTRLGLRLTATAALLGWLCFAGYLLYARMVPPRQVRVTDSRGNSAVLSGTGLAFSGPGSEAPVARLSVFPTAHLQLTMNGVPYVHLGISDLNGQLSAPFGSLALRAKDLPERILTAKPEPTSP